MVFVDAVQSQKYIHFLHNQPYSNPQNINEPLYRLPPPIIERFELRQDNVEGIALRRMISVLLSFCLSQLPTIFDQYGFHANDIKSDNEKNRDKNKSNEEKKDNVDYDEMKKDILSDNESSSYDEWLRQELQNQGWRLLESSRFLTRTSAKMELSHVYEQDKYRKTWSRNQKNIIKITKKILIRY